MFGIFKGKHVLVSASSNAESMYLLYLMKTIGDCSTLAVAYVDVQQGEDSGKAEELIRNHCLANQIHYHLISVDSSEPHYSNLTTWTREMRYDFLKKLDINFGYDHIVTAHTNDDQAEVMYSRVMYKANIRGLQGIKATTGKYVKPFIGLGIPKSYIYTQCEELGIKYMDLELSSKVVSKRAMARTEILQYNDLLKTELVNLANHCQAIYPKLLEEAKKKFLPNDCYPSESRVHLRKEIADPHDELLMLWLSELFDTRGLTLTPKQVELIMTNNKDAVAIDIGDGVRVDKRSADFITIIFPRWDSR